MAALAAIPLAGNCLFGDVGALDFNAYPTLVDK
jgi:hypothetical protein